MYLITVHDFGGTLDSTLAPMAIYRFTTLRAAQAAEETIREILDDTGTSDYHRIQFFDLTGDPVDPSVLTVAEDFRIALMSPDGY